jgi:hypothetical protein
VINRPDYKTTTGYEEPRERWNRIKYARFQKRLANVMEMYMFRMVGDGV